MSVLAPPRATPADSAPVGPSPRQRLRALAWPAALLALVLACAAVVAVAERPASTTALDPSAPTPGGTRALAVLLGEQGVSVISTRRGDVAAAVPAGQTLVIAGTAALNPAALQRLARVRADLVLLDPTPDALAVLAPAVSFATVAGGGESLAQPDCALPAAVRAGAASVGAVALQAQLTAGSTVTVCYPGPAAGGLVVVRSATGRSVAVLGDATAFTNAELAQQGNAALALNLLGAHSRLVWFLPVAQPVPTTGTATLASLLPVGVRVAAVGLVLAVAFLALARGRRLGPVVTERLPVAVPAAETTRGRGLLYRRLRARGPASAALRAAACQRLSAALAQPAAGPPTGLVTAVAARTGRATEDVAALLYGAPPGSDDALVALAAALDALEAEVQP